MGQSKHTKRALLTSVLSVVACCALLIGSTFAWFTDEVESGNNRIVAGNLDVELYHGDDLSEPVNGATDLFQVDTWEPGVIAYENFKVVNQGSLALAYRLAVNIGTYNTVKGEDGKDTGKSLKDVIRVAVTTEPFDGTREAALALDYQPLESFAREGSLLETGASDTYTVVLYWEPTAVDNDYNLQNGKTSSDGVPLFIDLGVKLEATQTPHEHDSFDDQYDKDAVWDGVSLTPVTPDAQGAYSIRTGAELAWIAQEVNNGNLGDSVTIELQNDIDLNGKAWEPIGGANTFSGTFDGNGHTIKNLRAYENKAAVPGFEDRSIGLIGYAVNAVVKDLKIENCAMSGRYAVGAVIGEGDGPLRFENIEIVSGTVLSDQDSPEKMAQVAGGILGIGYGDPVNDSGEIVFKNCINRSDVTVNKWHAGGLWGSITFAENASVTVENCHNYGNMTCLSQEGYAGGLGGYCAAKSLAITGSTNNGTITAQKYAGNFVGYWTNVSGPVNE